MRQMQGGARGARGDVLRKEPCAMLGEDQVQGPFADVAGVEAKAEVWIVNSQRPGKFQRLGEIPRGVLGGRLVG